MSQKKPNKSGLAKVIIARSDKPFNFAFTQFDVKLTALEEMNQLLPAISKLLYNEIDKSLEKSSDYAIFQEHMEKIASSLEKTTGSVELEVDDEKFQAFLKVYKKSTLLHCSRIIGDISLVYLIAEFEGFLKDILVNSFKRKPETLISCQKTVTYEDIVKHDDISQLKEQVIEKETSVVNEDIEEVSKYFKQRFNVDLSSFVDWNRFKERFYRRNIIIHNSAIPNERYILKTGYEGKKQPLIVSRTYLMESITLFRVMAQQIRDTFNDKMMTNREPSK